MKLVLNNGIIYEFIPINSDNFYDDVEVKADKTVVFVNLSD